MPSLRATGTIALGLIVVALTAILLAVFVNLRFIRDEGGGGYVLWRGDEAYLFVYDNPIGYRMSLLRYLLEPIAEALYAPASAEEDKRNLTILQITPTGVERHDQVSAIDIRDFTPISGEIYARCPGGVCKWAGTQFQLVSAQEERTKMGGEDRLASGEFANVSGWSKRAIQGASVGDDPGHYEFSIDLGERTRLLVRGNNPVSIDLLRAGDASERVWYHRQRAQRVSAAEYEQVFHHH